MPLRDERGLAPSAKGRRDEAPALLFPLDGAVVQVSLLAMEAHVDRASFALVPAGARYRVSARSPRGRLVTLLVGDAAVAAACAEYRGHVTDEGLRATLGTGQVFPRTRWVDELVQRYVFERVVCEKPASAAARFLVTELTKELFFLGRERRGAATRASVVDEGSDVVGRARAFIDAHLFEPFTVEALARHCHASASTLLRAFKKELRVPPLAYVRDRRLDEARVLLETRRFAVGEVAVKVGYASLPAFTQAFRRRFDELPSAVRARPADVVVLPPHGEPPSPGRRRRDSL
jgi:AraC-like DNA-binding protein